jgi:hypothetical protein
MANTSPQAGLRHKSIWDAQRHGQQVRGTGLVPMASVSFTGPDTTSDDADEYLFAASTFALCGEWQPVLCQVVCSDTFATDVAGAVIDVRNIGTDGTGTTNLSASGFSNVSSAITADTVFNVPIEGPGNATPTAVFVDENEVLVLHFEQTGAGVDYSAAIFHVTLYGIQSPPSRSAFQQ